MPARVSSDRLGSDAITLLRSTNPGIVIPTRLSSSLAARTPLMAIRAMCIAPAYERPLRSDCGGSGTSMGRQQVDRLRNPFELDWTDLGECGLGSR